ncbi:transposase [Streptomyces roseochromogenus]|uniref:Transposase DDE domain-containing protein n=1 Tax=Streptomyces roseochromogenus subsp. oscitans DS 12.976 TaxID=1352936 RepID=V6JGW1_STRRC|nr:hypothetical protein M878_44335 [Streptomyces roseochromogenus subsp. oscitans DS 12.976]
MPLQINEGVVRLDFKGGISFRVEGAIAQGLRRCGLRRSRYTGMDKTCLQHVLTATALNLIRTDAWLTQTPLAKTRTSGFTRLRPA